MYQEMKLWFQNKYDDTNASGQVHLESGADSLPRVMEAFEQFLRQAGFTYIELLTDGESWQFIKKRDLSTFESDCGYFDDVEDQGDEWTEDSWDLFKELGDAAEQAYDAEVQQDILDEEAKAYEAERTYHEAYYDPFTRDVKWEDFFKPEETPALKVGAKVRVTHPDLGDSKFVFGREGTVDNIADVAPRDQTVRVKFPPPAISAGPGHETNVWWIKPDALEVIG